METNTNRINLPEDFADRIIERINEREAAAPGAFSSPARAVLSVLLIVINMAAGILIGTNTGEGLRNRIAREHGSTMTEMMNAHHLSPLNSWDVFQINLD